MSVLYIETDATLRRDLEWAWYSEDKGKVEIWEDYISNYGHLTIISPYKKKICNKNQKDLIKLGNKYELEKNHITLEYIDDLYENKLGMLNRALKEYIKHLIAREVKSDEYELIVIGNDKNFYQKQALKYAETYNKKTNILN